MSELLGAKQKNPKTAGVRYRLHIKKEGCVLHVRASAAAADAPAGQLDSASKGISLSANEAYLMHDRTLIDCAANFGLLLLLRLLLLMHLALTGAQACIWLT